MKIFLIRHGESTGDIEDRYGGDYDDHLTETGKKQAEFTGDELRDEHIQVVYHSPLLRAKEAAHIIGQKIHVPLVEIKNIRERNSYGILTGLTKKEGLERFPDEVAKLQKSKYFHDVKNSEPYDGCLKRLTIALKPILDDSRHKNIAIISHGVAIYIMVREIFKLGETKLENGAVIEIVKEREKYSLQKLSKAVITPLKN